MPELTPEVRPPWEMPWASTRFLTGPEPSFLKELMDRSWLQARPPNLGETFLQSARELAASEHVPALFEEAQGGPDEVLAALELKIQTNLPVRAAAGRFGEARLQVVSGPQVTQEWISSIIQRLLMDAPSLAGLTWESKQDRRARDTVILALGILPDPRF